MPNRTAAAVLGLAICLSARAADAAEASALKVLGFSPDGRHFAFMQYGPQWEAERIYGEVFVIDAERDRFVQGVPVRVSARLKEDSTEDNIEPQLKTFLANVQKRAAGVLNAHKIGRPGVLLASVASAHATEHSSGSEMPAEGQGAAAVMAQHPVLGELAIKLEIKVMDWPKTSRLGSHKEAASCAEEAVPEKGAAFRLTLDQGGRSIVLHDDKTIPASRNCVGGYGIAAVHALDRPDGKVTLAVVLGMHTRGFEGMDRTFLAVTRVLAR